MAVNNLAHRFLPGVSALLIITRRQNLAAPRRATTACWSLARRIGPAVHDLLPRSACATRCPSSPCRLRPPHADARLDLQAALHRVYDAAFYKDYVYRGEPQPPLVPEDAALAQAVRAGGGVNERVTSRRRPR